MKRAITILATLAIIGVTFSAAYARTTTPRSAKTTCNAKGNIKYQYWGSPGSNIEQKRASRAAEKACPGLHVQDIWFQGNYDGALTTELGNGTAPDVFQLDEGERTPEFVSQHAVVNLAPYLKSHHINFKTTFNPICAKMAYYKGQGPYGFVSDCGAQSMLMYNKDMFKARHVAFPTNSWTLTDLRKAAVKLTGTYAVRGGAKELRFGIGMQQDQYRINGYMLSFGGNWVTSSGKCGLTSKGSREGLSGWRDLIYKYHAAPTPAQQGPLGDPGVTAFKAEREAMTLTGPWSMDYIVKQNDTGGKPVPFKWGVVLPPAGPLGHNGSIDDGALESVYIHSKHLKAAEAFAYYVTTSKAAALEGQYGIGIPAGNVAAKQKIVKQEYAPYYKTWVQGSVLATPLRTVPKHTQFQDAVLGTLNDFWSGKLSVNQATTAACNAAAPYQG